MKHKIIPFVLFVFVASIVTAQNVGFGQNNPKANLDINGSLVVGTGSGYSGTATSVPANGAIIQGPVSIGNSGSTGSAILDLTNSSNLGFILPTISAPAPGGIQATAQATMVGGSVTGITVTNPGSLYSGVYTATTITITPATIQVLEVEQGVVSGSKVGNTKTIVYPDTLYNYRISPARNAMRWVKSIFQSYADWLGGVLYFISGEANIKATGLYNGTAASVVEASAITEDQDISYEDFATDMISDYYPLYSNQIVRFTYPLSYTDWKTLTTNPPYGLIAYSVNGGEVQKGWIEELKYNPFEGTAEFTLKVQA